LSPRSVLSTFDEHAAALKKGMENKAVKKVKKFRIEKKKTRHTFCS